MRRPKFGIHKIILAFTLALILLMPACRRISQQVDQAPEANLAMELQPSPAMVGDGVVRITLEDGSGSPIQGASLEVRGDMTHPGMTPEFGVAVEMAPGVYETPFSWSMAGDWILTVSGQLPDGRQIVRTLEVNVSSDAAEGGMDMSE
ncbi:MAG: FixH family protein [Anaerolineales bacterium]